MYTPHLPLCLLTLCLTLLPAGASSWPEFTVRQPESSTSVKHFARRLWTTSGEVFEKRQGPGSSINSNPDGSPFLWLPEDDFHGKDFFDAFDFFWNDTDPTHGSVNYVNSSVAFNNSLAYVTEDNKVVMRTDNTTWLPFGTHRDSVRIESKKVYNTGLFILDLDRAPWGCAVWPAFWTFGDSWPNNGEIDILEGVHNNSYNQIAWHTRTGCYLDPAGDFTGTIPNYDGQDRTNCSSEANFNAGCDIVEWSRASYGPLFEEQGGGVLAMKWDENDIAVWSFFRAAIPKDIIDAAPNPSLWGRPSARLLNTRCNITDYFANHRIIFDITLCGDWAGASYDTSGCPGKCAERLMEPQNFVNATWSINSLKVYKKHRISDFTPTSTALSDLRIRACMVLLSVLAGTFVFFNVVVS